MKIDWNRLPPQVRTPEATRIAVIAAAGLCLAVLYVLLAPSWYSSTLTVVPATPSKGGLGTQLAGALGAAIDLPGDLSGNADVERIAAVLESTSMADAVIAKFDLRTRYDETYIEHARKRLWSHCSTRIDRKAKLVALTCEDKDPKFVQSMLEYFGEYGNAMFRRVSTSSASEEVKFLEQRVAEMRKETDEAAQRLREFEEKHKIVDLESQSRAVVSTMASLRSQEIAKELQLSYLNSFSAKDESTAIQLRQQLDVMGAKFRRLENDEQSASEASRSAKANIFPAALSVPRLRFELEQLYRDKKIHEADLLLLMQRLEMAHVNEARDTSTFVIFDPPALPTYRSRPKRLLVLVVGFLGGLILGLALQFGPPAVRMALAPDSDQ